MGKCHQMVTYSDLCYKNTCTNALLIFTYLIISRFLIFRVFWKNWRRKTTLCVQAFLTYQRDSFSIVYRLFLTTDRRSQFGGILLVLTDRRSQFGGILLVFSLHPTGKS